MSDEFIRILILKHGSVANAVWKSNDVIEITRKEKSNFQAAILKEREVSLSRVLPFLEAPISVIVNFPKIGKWTGKAIEMCEAHGKAWGQWGVMMRALGTETPEEAVNPEIAFSRRGLLQHSRVSGVSYISDHVLLVTHNTGKAFRVALLYEYDLCGSDVRDAWTRLGPFDILLKTNPNGSILSDARSVAENIGIVVFRYAEILSFLGRARF